MTKKAVGEKDKKTKKSVARKSEESVNGVNDGAEKYTGDAAVRKRGIDHKTWILVGFAIIALAIVIVLILKFAVNEKYDSSYFHDSNNKIVLTMDRDSAALEDSVYEPNITHVVYYYSGDKVTAARAFYEYKDEAEAKEAYSHLGLGDFADSKRLSGRFVVFQLKPDRYADTTVEKLRQDIELLKGINALILDYDEKTIENYGKLDFGGESSEEAGE